MTRGLSTASRPVDAARTPGQSTTAFSVGRADFSEQVASATDRSIVPYNVPHRTGVAIAPETVARLSEAREVLQDLRAEFVQPAT